MHNTDVPMVWSKGYEKRRGIKMGNDDNDDVSDHADDVDFFRSLPHSLARGLR